MSSATDSGVSSACSLCRVLCVRGLASSVSVSSYVSIGVRAIESPSLTYAR